MRARDMTPLFEGRCCGLCEDSCFNEPCGYKRISISTIPNICAICNFSKRKENKLVCTFTGIEREEGQLSNEVGLFWICSSFTRRNSKDIRQIYDPK